MSAFEDKLILVQVDPEGFSLFPTNSPVGRGASDEERTFFAYMSEDGVDYAMTLVVPETDPRHEGMFRMGQGDYGHDGPTQYYTWRINRQHTHPIKYGNVEIPVPAQEPEKTLEVQELERRIAQLNETIATLRNTVSATTQRHHEDIDRISERLILECVQRNWCSDYDKVVDDLNSQLHIGLQRREREYEVEVTVSYRLTTRYMATSEEDAEAYVDTEDFLEQAQIAIGNGEASERIEVERILEI